MDQGVLETLKRHYRRFLLQTLLENSSNNKTFKECLLAINMKNVIYWSAQAWDAIQRSTIQKSWAKILNSDSQSDEVLDNIDLYSMMEQIPGCANVEKNDTDEWANGDDCEHELTDDEICQLVNSEEEIADETGDNEMEESQYVNHEEGLNALELTLKYVEEQSEATASDLLLIKRWRDIAAKKRMSKLNSLVLLTLLSQ
ncbi:jerky protein homolog-like [Linepithema humile]|uniref:jerky protein homolog-like n=1 Tax=Linepithema humile TaxID=83485 RepID=UPI00351E3E78